MSDNTDIFQDPAYIVLNVPSPTADEVRGIRSFFDPPRANMAVEISLCGSNVEEQYRRTESRYSIQRA